MQHTELQLALRMKSPLGLAGTDTIYYSNTHSENKTTSTVGDHYVESKLSTGPITHKLTTGFSHDDTEYEQNEYDSPSALVQPYSPYTFSRSEGTHYSLFAMNSKQMGAYAVDMLTWGDVNLLLGLRRSRYETESSVSYLTSGSRRDTPKQAVWETTPGIGIVYNLTPSISTYANYAEGFSPQLGYRMCEGSKAEPMRTKNREAGMKFDLLDSKFSITTAAFSLEQSNTMVYSAAGACYTQQAAQKTKGLELDMAGELYKGLNVLFNTTYSTVEDLSGSKLEFAARPKYKASLWSTYEFQSAALRGWGVGMGITANDKSWLGDKYATSTSDPVKLSGSARTDASISYRQKDWSVILGVKNLFDRELYDFATTTSYVPLQQGRTATLTYKVKL